MLRQGILKNSRLIAVVFIITTSILQAESVTLSEDLTLHVPVLEYKMQDQTHYFKATLEHQKEITNPITFVVKDHNVLSTDQIPPSLLDLKLVTKGEPPKIVDITKTQARLTFISRIPLVCAVIYGKMPELGQIATDSNMNGGAIIDHNPLLTGLEENTLYHYRVQGSDASGKIYWSPSATFKTSSTATMDDNVLSLNNGATITSVSSNFSGAKNNDAFGANNAIDGSHSTAWSSNGDGDNAFIEIALAKSQKIATLGVHSRSMTDGTAKILSFTVTIDTGEVLGPFVLPNTKQTHLFPLNIQTNSIRLDVKSSTGGNTGLMEIIAYDIDPATTTDSMM